MLRPGEEDGPPRFGQAFRAHRERLGLPPQRSPWTSPEAHRSKMRRVSPPTVTDEAMPDAPDPRVSPTTRAELVQLAREDPDALQALVSEVLREAARQNEAAPTAEEAEEDDDEAASRARVAPRGEVPKEVFWHVLEYWQSSRD